MSEPTTEAPVAPEGASGEPDGGVTPMSMPGYMENPDALPCGTECRWSCEPSRGFNCRQGAAAGAKLPIMEWAEATGDATGAHVTWSADFRGGTISSVIAAVDGGTFADMGIEQNFDIVVAGAAGSEHYVTVSVVTDEGMAPNPVTARFTKTA